MKKTISFLICFILLFNALVITVNAESSIGSDGRLEEAKELFGILKIVPNTAETDENAMLSRAEFALYVGRILGADEYKGSDVRYFRDVAMDHWAASSVQLLAERNIISVPDDRLFRPEELITFNEAEKILLSAMGYSPYAEAAGGFPAGYASVAKRLDLTDGTEITANVTLGQGIVLIYNALNTDLYDSTSFKNNSAVFAKNEGTNLLTTMYDCYLAEGQLTSADGVSVNYNEDVRNDKIRIDDTDYYADDSLNAYSYLGLSVRAYYIKENKNDIGKIILIKRDYNEFDKMNVIDSDDFKLVDSEYNLYYYTDGGNTEKKLRIAQNARILKNGEILTQKLTEEMNSFFGTVTLIDSDNNNVYDIVLIDTYTNAVVKSVSEKDNTIYFDNGNTPLLDIEKYKADKKTIYSSDGYEITIGDIEQGDIVSIYESAKTLRIYDCKKSVTGVLNHIYGTVPVKISVGGEEYIVDSNAIDKDELQLCLGDECTVSFDIRGNVANIKKGTISDFKTGYLVKTDFKSGIDNTLEMKIFTVNNGMQVYGCKDKVEINGERVDKSIAVNKLKENTGASKAEHCRQLIRFKTNSSGKITAIDTDYYNQGKESEDTLRKDVELGKYVYASSPKMFGPKCIIDKNTVIIGVPDEDSYASSTDNDYALMSTANFKSGTSYSIESYKTDTDTFYSNIVLYKGSVSKAITPETDFMLVESIGRASYEDTECEYLSGAINGTKKIFYADEKFSLVNEGVEEGDVVRLGYTKDDRINSVEIMYDYSTGNLNQHRLLYASFFNTIRFVYGTVAEKNGNLIKVGFSSPLDYDEIEDLTGIPVMVYDSSLRENKVYIGNSDDVRDYKTYGTDASRLYARTENGKLTKIVLYK